ncbi:MAG: ABC transporter substrate-binding protein [Propionibacteriaceae bacterium]|jgi:ABC-type branched-subunit amino acid transport system substrate-binding protein|nr:ABC transporter substrate-binding protein [Propionibacteriaceae bacterium]
MNTNKVVASLVGVLLAISLVGCTKPADGPVSVDDGTQGITDTTVLIANSAATSGAYAPVGVPFIAGMQAYIDTVNAAGGIDGRKIEFLHTDDEFDPAKGSAALTEFVEDDKVFAIVGYFGTPVVAANLGALKEYGIPSVYFATGIGQLYAEKASTNADGYNIFPVQPIYRTEGSIMVAYAAGKFEAKKIGIIYTNDDAGMDLEKGAVAQINKLDGIEYVEQQVAAGAADVSAAVTAIKNADVDFIIVASIQGTMPTIVKELAAQGVNKDCITTYVNVSSAMSEAVLADITDKFDLYGLGWVDTESAFTQAALGDYQKSIASEYAMNAYAQTGWIAASFFAEGLRRLEGKDVTWTSYMEALQSAPIQNPFGGFINYADGQRLGTQDMNLSKVVPASDRWAAGWELVEPVQSISDLLQ